MLTLGMAYNYVALPAALLSFAAMSSLLLYGRYKRQQAADSPGAGETTWGRLQSRCALLIAGCGMNALSACGFRHILQA